MKVLIYNFIASAIVLQCSVPHCRADSTWLDANDYPSANSSQADVQTSGDIVLWSGEGNPTHEGDTLLDVDDDRPLTPNHSFDLACCAGGKPKVDERLETYVVAFDVQDNGAMHGDGCNRFTGHYTLNTTAIPDYMDWQSLLSVSCDCPDRNPKLDRNCRYLPNCHNGGYRAFRNGLRCVCHGSFFGEQCEHYCEHGQRLKNPAGRDFCECDSHYIKGIGCNIVMCVNGHTSLSTGSGCVCRQPYAGRHCEHKLNRTVANNNPQILQRDISGSLISLVLVLGLIIAIYCLIRRRVIVRRQLMLDGLRGRHAVVDAASRERERRREIVATFEALRSPPPYLGADGGPAGVSGGSYSLEDLPPLPSYDDAIKCAASVHTPVGHHGSAITNQVARPQSDQSASILPRTAQPASAAPETALTQCDQSTAVLPSIDQSAPVIIQNNQPVTARLQTDQPAPVSMQSDESAPSSVSNEQPIATDSLGQVETGVSNLVIVVDAQQAAGVTVTNGHQNAPTARQTDISTESNGSSSVVVVAATPEAHTAAV